MPHDTCDLNSLNSDQTHAYTVEVWSPNHWTTREIPIFLHIYLINLFIFAF